MARRAYSAAVAIYEDYNRKPLEYLPELDVTAAYAAVTDEASIDEMQPNSTADAENPDGAENIIFNENTSTRESDYVKNDSDC